MLFNSYSFLLLFLPISLLVFYGLLLRKSADAAIAGLGVCSLVFYAWWDIGNLPLLIASIIGNFVLARRIAHRSGRARRLLYIIGIILNLLLLGLFKYAGFISSNLHAVSSNIPVMHVALPLAISFFTFQQISFLRGVYDHHDYVPRFIRYGTFISFFPHLIAGPILHHKDIQPQFGALERHVPWQSIAAGITLFSIGLFKKVMIADPIGLLADPLFTDTSSLSLPEAWGAVTLYGFQLYFDFSGYSDMAIGLAALFGIRFPTNFNSPYRATSIADFWRRWHITLSQFLRDFLYIPLGGNRRGVPRTLLNLIITMALGGLWHGASWNFLIWGLVHGGLLTIHALWQRIGITLPTIAAWALTFFSVMAAWGWFRAPDTAAAISLYSAMIDISSLRFSLPAPALVWIVGALALCLTLPNPQSWVRDAAPVLGLTSLRYHHSAWVWCFTLILFLVAFAHVSRLSIFLYFNF